MKKNFLANIGHSVTRSVHRIGFGLEKRSPEILIVLGVSGVVVAAVKACLATRRLDEVLDDTHDKIKNIHENADDNEMLDPDYNVKKELTLVYVDTGVKLVKLYAPSVMLGALSIAGILKSNQISRRRNVALAAAYATLDKTFVEYRDRVVERFGKETEEEIRYNLKKTDTVETVVGEDGTETTVTNTITTGPAEESDVMRYFDASNDYWDDDDDYAEMFFRQRERWANDRLTVNGCLTLNEVFEALGMKPTKPGMILGWLYDENCPRGDNYVTFRTKKVYRPNENGGFDKAYLFDFNVDGNIYKML